jgi:hypothetical protein
MIEINKKGWFLKDAVISFGCQPAAVGHQPSIFHTLDNNAAGMEPAALLVRDGISWVV